MAVGVTGSLVAALALSYAVFPGSVVPRSAQQGLGTAAAERGPSTAVVVPAARMGDPLRQRTGAMASVVVTGKDRRALTRAETAARGELVSAVLAKGNRPPADTVTAAFLTAGIALVRSSATEKGKDGAARTSATAAGRTVDVGIGSTTAAGRIRTVALVESGAGPQGPSLRSVESLDGLPCPDEDGRIDLAVRVEVDVTARRGEAPVSTVAAAEVLAEVDAGAELTGAQALLSTSTTAGGGGDDVTGEVDLSTSGPLGEVVATDPPAEGPARRRAEEGLAAARALAVGALAAAQERWSTGGCVAVRASLPDEVEEGSTTGFAPKIVSRLGGERVEAEIVVEVDGPGTVREDGDGLVFVAGGERGRTSTVRVRAVSRRGVAQTTLEVATPSPDLRVDAAYKSVRLRGVKCAGPTGRWEMDLVGAGGSVGGLSFRLDDSLLGGYSGSRRFSSLAGTITVSEGGVVRYLADRRLLVLSDREGGQIEVPVEIGAYC